MQAENSKMVARLGEARGRLLSLVDDLDEDSLRGNSSAVGDAPLWHMGHVAWFQEFWCLRRVAARTPKLAASDALYDTRRLAGVDRARLDLPPLSTTRGHLSVALDLVTGQLERDELDSRTAWFHALAIAHEDMHTETLVLHRQTAGLPAPVARGDLYEFVSSAFRSGRTPATERGLRIFEALLADELARTFGGARPTVRMELATGRIRVRRDGVELPVDVQLLSDLGARILHREMMEHLTLRDRSSALDAASTAGPCVGDVEFAGGVFLPGAGGDEPFAFDNERGGAATEVAPFRMARAPVTQSEFAAFVEARGYETDAYWTEAGRRWRDTHMVRAPMHWQRGDGGRWLRRHFDAWRPIEEHRPIAHVNAYEAEAWCRWAGRRLPTEIEWEFGATANRDGTKRRHPWGDTQPDARRAHFELASAEYADVGAHPEGDTPDGLRQMLGNVWEWTSSTLTRYPVHRPGVVAHYDQHAFDRQRVLRGGSFATATSNARACFRHFLPPEERNAFAGFRTCSLRA